MLDVRVSRFADLASDEDSHLHLSKEREVPLAAVEYLAKAAPGSTDYRAMVDACCEAGEPLTDALFANNFRAWLFLVGGKRNSEMRRRLPNSALAKLLERQHILGPAATEYAFPLSELERTAGLYLVAESKFCEACWFMTHNSWSIAILSQREEFLSEETLALVYKAAAFDDSREPVTTLNWSALSATVCPMADVVVKTYGAFDDRERAVNFIYDPRNPIIKGSVLGAMNPEFR
jgi:hypothetical protein